MALLDRVKERIETDLSDSELQAMIDEVTAEIERRHGATGEITVQRGGGMHTIMFNRPIDTGEAVAVVEIESPAHGAAASRTTLAADDFRLLHGGRTLERLVDGTNGRLLWAPLVEVTYTPVSSALQRDEIVIKIVQLDITYRGLDKQVSAGDLSLGGSVTSDAYSRERDALLAQLAPRGGMMMA